MFRPPSACPFILRVLTLCMVGGMLLLGSGCRAADDGRIHLTWISGRDDHGIDHELCRRFEAQNPGVIVHMIEMPSGSDTMHNQYATYLMAEDDSIDVYSIDVVWSAEFGSAGWAVPLDERMPDGERTKFLKGPLGTCLYKDHLYALPWYTDAGGLFYRKDLLDAAHLAPPATWQQLVDISQKLQDAKRRGFVFQCAQYEGLICNFLEYLWTNGGTVLDDKGQLVLDTEGNAEALQFLVDIIYKYKITPESIETYDEEKSLRDFQNGDAVFLRNWPYVWGSTQKPGEPLLGKIGVVPFPHNDRPGLSSAACLGGWNLMVSRYSRHIEVAYKFAHFMTSFEAERDELLVSNHLPTVEAVFSDPTVLEKRPASRQFLDIFKASRPRPVTPYYSRLSDILQRHVHRALASHETVTPAQALKDAAAEMRRIPGFQASP